MRLQEDLDFTTLSWVKAELDETLKQARHALEAYVEDPTDASQMRFCATYLHQVQGTLRMVELYGAAMVTEEMEQLAMALLGDDIGDRDEAYTVLMRGIVQLPDYLERLQTGYKDIPIVLLPLLNDLRAARGEKGLSESVLFTPDLGRPLPTAAAGPQSPLPDLELRKHAAALRTQFQLSLLKWFRGDDVPVHGARLSQICERLVATVSQEDARRLFWVAGGLLQAMHDGAFEPNQQLKQTIGRVEREIKRLGDAGEASFRLDPPRELTRNLLYFVAHAPADHVRLVELRRVFDLASLLPSEQELEHARGSISGHNRALLDTVSAGIKEDLLRVKDALDLHMRTQSGDLGSLATQAEVLTRVADTLGMLGLGVPRRVVIDQRDTVQQMADGNRATDEATLLDVAGALLYVEASLDDQVQHLGAAPQNSGAPVAGLPQAEARRVLETVVKEAQANFAQAKLCFVAFVESNWDHAQLDDVPRLLDEVAGALRILELDEPPRYLVAVRRFTERELLDRRRVPNGVQMDTLADALASLEYYLEALRDQRAGRDRIVDVARQRLESLGYWPIPDDKAASVIEPAVAPVAAVTEARGSSAVAAPSTAPSAPVATPTPSIEPVAEAAAADAPAADAVEAFVAADVEASGAERANPTAAELPTPIAAAAVAPMTVVTAEPPQAIAFGFDGGGEDIDEEIREVFIEEVQEEIANLDELMPRWRANPELVDALKPIRRVFHTLKGSGRLVGAMALGEFSWKVENMLNRVLDQTVAPTPAVIALVGAAHEALPQLLGALRGDNAIVTADLEQIKDVADRLSAGDQAWLVDRNAGAAVSAADLADGAGAVEASMAGVTGSGESEVAAIDPIALEVAGSEPVDDGFGAIEPGAIEPGAIEPGAIEPGAIEPGAIGADAIETAAIELDAIAGDFIEPDASGYATIALDSAELPLFDSTIELASADLLSTDVGSIELESIELASIELDTHANHAIELESIELQSTEVDSHPPVATEPDAIDPEAIESEAIDPDAIDPDAIARDTDAIGFDAQPDSSAADAPVIGERTPFSIDPVLFDILKSEVAGHLETVDGFVAESAHVRQPASDPLLRAVHTMAGAFAMTEVPHISDVVGPAEGYIKRLLARHEAPTRDGVALLGQMAIAVRQLIVALDGSEPHAPEFPQLADALAALRDTLPEPMGPLLPMHPDVDAATVEPATEAARAPGEPIGASELDAAVVGLAAGESGDPAFLDPIGPDEAIDVLAATDTSETLEAFEFDAAPALDAADGIETITLAADPTSVELPMDDYAIDLDAIGAVDLDDALAAFDANDAAPAATGAIVSDADSTAEGDPASGSGAFDDAVIRAAEAFARRSIDSEADATTVAAATDTERDGVLPTIASAAIESAAFEPITTLADVVEPGASAAVGFDEPADSIEAPVDAAAATPEALELPLDDRIEFEEFVLDAGDPVDGGYAPEDDAIAVAPAAPEVGDSQFDLLEIDDVDDLGPVPTGVAAAESAVAESAAAESVATWSRTASHDHEAESLVALLLREEQPTAAGTDLSPADLPSGIDATSATDEALHPSWTSELADRSVNIDAADEIAATAHDEIALVSDAAGAAQPTTDAIESIAFDTVGAVAADAASSDTGTVEATSIDAEVEVVDAAVTDDWTGEADKPEAEPVETDAVGSLSLDGGSADLESDASERADIAAPGFAATDFAAAAVDAGLAPVEAASVEAEPVEAEPIESELLEPGLLEPGLLEADPIDASLLDAQPAASDLRDFGDEIAAEAVEDAAADEDVRTDDDAEPATVAASDFTDPVRSEPAPRADTAASAGGALAALAAADPDPDGALELADMDEELLDIFLEEGADILDHSDGLLARLRENPSDRELVVGLQRDLHTLKGGARMAGIAPIGDLGHAMESLLEAVAEGKRELHAEALEVLERAFDRLHGMVTRVGERHALAMPQTLVACVEALVRGEALPLAGAAAAPAAPAPLAERLPTPTLIDEAEDEEPAVRAPQEQIRIRADLLDRLVNYAGEVAIYRARLEQQLGAFRGSLAEMDQTTSRLREQLRRLEIETEAQIIARYQREGDEAKEEFDPLELDRFSTQQQLSRALSESAADLSNLQGTLDDLTRQYETLLLQQSRVSSELQEGLMRTRMVPFDALVPRLRRILRQSASELGKKAQLKVDGAQGEMDRNVLDRMTAPLEHLLRNAIAHGLESPQERVAAGKPEEGTVRITVVREGSEVVIRAGDDGRGLSRDAIRRKAIERGLLDPSVQLPDRELYAFILESGFSTAEKVSKIAGRGVGMDVVYSEIKQLGGSLHIESQPGRGTEFVIRLPFTLAVTQAVFVKINDTQFAIPISSVQGVSRIPPVELQQQLDGGDPQFEYAGEDYAIYDLGLLLGQNQVRATESLQVPLLLARSGDLRAAICVDQVIGSREIVVKPTGPQVNSIPGIFGATVMGDGSVVVILDVAPLVRRAVAHRLAGDAPLQVAEVEQRRIPLVMVVDDSITMRKVTGRVLERSGYEVMTAKDGIDAIEKLQERIPDVMLLDIEMPRMDGYELATHIRNDVRLRGIPIIMITSRTGDKHRQRAFEIGVDRYLGKPYQEAELMRNVGDILKVGRD